jgi:hypothetical protein
VLEAGLIGDLAADESTPGALAIAAGGEGEVRGLGQRVLLQPGERVSFAELGRRELFGRSFAPQPVEVPPVAEPPADAGAGDVAEEAAETPAAEPPPVDTPPVEVPPVEPPAAEPPAEPEPPRA